MIKRFISLFLILAVIFTQVPFARAEEPFQRIYGENRYETAFAIADQMKVTMGVDKFNAVIVACGTNFADALAGSYLASVCRAPILLAHNAKYNAMVKDYIRANLQPGHTVFILGGDKAVSKDMEQGLDGFHVVRLAGATRYETNLSILREAGILSGSEILVATGTDFADCLSASATGKPIFLVQKQLTASQKEYLSQLENCSFCIIGGTNAVSSNLEMQLSSYGPTERIGGNTRYETSVNVAKRFFSIPDTAVLAYAMNFPDGLCGGPLAQVMDAPLIITATKREQQACAYTESVCIGSGIVLGGPGLIGDNSCRNIFSGTHLWNEWTVIQAPTMEAEGLENRICGKCGREESRTIEKLPLPTQGATLLSPEADTQLKADLDTKIHGILNTQTQIVHSDTYIPGKTYTGTAYYISNEGDDSNDGRSPETAWQSVSRLLQELDRREGSVMQPGDAIFLRRGDVFRLPEWSLDISLERVTVSAYGEGAKPIITMSSENGSGAEKWEQIYEDASGKKIWKFYRDIRDVSMIVMNDGEVITERVYEYYDGTQYISCEPVGWWMHEDVGIKLMDGLLSPEDAMTKDMTFICRPEEKIPGEDWRGPLYLRCDAGNPGQLYSSIEFTELGICGIIWLKASDVVFDNISFRCNGNSFIKNAFNSRDLMNSRIQNCEFAYGGGCVSFYHTSETGKVTVEAQGDGVYNLIQNTTIENNYFHDSRSTAFTYEWDLSDTAPLTGYYHVLNNVMVNTMGLRLDSTADALKQLDSVIVRGNQVWNTGHWDVGKIMYSEGSLVLMPNNYGECIIENNVFYGTENGHPMNSLLDIFLYSYEEQGYTRPQFRNNIYAQYQGLGFADLLMHQGETWCIEDPDLVTKAQQQLQDTDSTFYIIP